MAEITQVGYKGIRDFIQANWKFIELRNAQGVKIVRLSTDDQRVSFTHAAGAQTLELSIVITGADAEITLPTTFASSVLFTSGDSTEAVTAVESFSPFEMTMAEDQITVRHRIEVPQI